jgi:hypothetical protein
MKSLAKYAKSITAAIGVAATVLTALNVHTTWVAAVVAAATALGVYAVPNKK